VSRSWTRLNERTVIPLESEIHAKLTRSRRNTNPLPCQGAHGRSNREGSVRAQKKAPDLGGADPGLLFRRFARRLGVERDCGPEAFKTWLCLILARFYGVDICLGPVAQ
jgi:hypothetical protein